MSPVAFHVLILYGDRPLMVHRNEDGRYRYIVSQRRMLASRAFTTIKEARQAVRSSATQTLIKAGQLASIDVELSIRRSDGKIVWSKLFTSKRLTELVYEIEKAERVSQHH